MSERYRVGVVGARGYTGAELLRLLNGHPDLEVAHAGSRELAGEPVPQVEGLIFESLDAGALADRDLDAIFLALPDGLSESFVEAASAETVIVDISSDHRWDPEWSYGLPELYRDKIEGSRRVANPGCYATAMQLSVAPFSEILSGTPAVFGVSGYSGAGTIKGPRNDPVQLADNLIPYKLVGHNHEREASFNLGHDVRFMPHVHQAFRGLITTSHIPVSESVSAADARSRLEERYAGEPLIEFQTEAPDLHDGAGRVGVLIGGVESSENGHNIVLVAAEDNLLKGAAVQAVQNLNLALGIPEFSGIL